MKNNHKILILGLVCTLFLFPQGANARGVAGTTINYAAKTAYCLTKYTLKTGWFIARKGTKCAVAVTRGVFNGTKDAFHSTTKPKPVGNSKNNYKEVNDNYYIETLPPAPKF